MSEPITLEGQDAMLFLQRSHTYQFVAELLPEYIGEAMKKAEEAEEMKDSSDQDKLLISMTAGLNDMTSSLLKGISEKLPKDIKGYTIEMSQYPIFKVVPVEEK